MSTEKTKIEPQNSEYPHLMKMHHSFIHSPLSKEAKPTNYHGFINLALLLLFAANFRLVLENLTKHGLLISIPGSYIPLKDWVLAIIILGVNYGTVVIAYYLEQLQIPQKENNEKQFSTLLWLNICVNIGFPAVVVYCFMFHPILGCLLMTNSSITLLKLTSYKLVNSDLRTSYLNDFKITDYELEYPNNINWPNYKYFLLAPTLCYQPSYPKSEKSFRVKYFIKRMSETIAIISMMYFLVEQYATPILTSQKEFQNLPFLYLLERLLKLSTVSVAIWLMGFYALFHSFLNAVSEWLQFGDREFYLPWWNSNSIEEYWRTWNQPVHHWLKRHIYVPCVKRGMGKKRSALLIFLFSAIFHELIFGLPTHSLKGYAFWSMAFQPLLGLICNWIKGYKDVHSSFGNCFFWLTFCIIGQPLLLTLYYYDWTHNL